MGSRVGATLRNPLVVIVPLVVVCWFGWSVYMQTINRPDHAEHNLLQGGEFESLGKGGLPVGWSADATDGVSYFPSKVSGYGGGNAFEASIDRYSSGNLDIKSPIIAVRPGTSYFYKSYHKATRPFWILMRDYHKDGSSTLHTVREYGTAEDWATDSIAFRPDAQTVRVQIVYRMAARGTLTLDRAFVDRRNGVYVPDEPEATNAQLLTNGDVSVPDDDMPEDWNDYHEGNNAATLSYVQQDGGTFLRTKIAKYKSGEAKWEHEPIDSAGGQYVSFAVDYRSSAMTKIVAEYALADGKRSFVTLDTVPPASDWTTFMTHSEAPEGAVDMTINVVLTANGTLDTDNYRIADLTKPGERHFTKPLVSFAFADGWESGYTTAARIMGYLKYKATFYVNPAAIDQPAFLTTAEIKNLVGSGHQVAAGSNEYVDLTTLNSRQLQRQLQLSHDYFVKQFHQGNIDFAPTSGHDDPAIQALSHSYFRSSMSGEEGLNTKQNFDPYTLKTFYVDKKTTAKRLQTALDEAKQKHGWLILVYHRIQDNTDSPADVTSKAFTNQVDQVHASGISVRAVGDALEYVWGQ